MGRRRSIGLLKYADNVSNYKAGDVVFSEGTLGTHMYVVKSGSVELRVGGRPVEKVESGGILGEMALLDGETRSATAVAASACELVPVDQEKFEYLVRQTPYFALEVMQIMALRLRHMNQDRKPPQA